MDGPPASSSNSERVVPAGACPKRRYGRVYAAVSELGGEPAKLVPWGPDGKMRQQMGFHSIRHLYGSLLADGAYSLADVTRRMQHKNHTTTLDIYTHLVVLRSATSVPIAARSGIETRTS